MFQIDRWFLGGKTNIDDRSMFLLLHLRLVLVVLLIQISFEFHLHHIWERVSPSSSISTIFSKNRFHFKFIVIFWKIPSDDEIVRRSMSISIILLHQENILNTPRRSSINRFPSLFFVNTKTSQLLRANQVDPSFLSLFESFSIAPISFRFSLIDCHRPSISVLLSSSLSFDHCHFS